MSGGMDYIRKAYGVPAKVGMRVQVAGTWGRITGTTSGYLRVRFDGRRSSINFHPTWQVRYYDDAGDLLLDTDTEEAGGEA